MIKIPLDIPIFFFYILAEFNKVYEGNILKRDVLNKLLLFLFTFLRMGLGIIFIISAATKFLNLETFSENLNDFKLFSQFQIALITYLLPVTELVIACLLLFNIKIRFTATATLYLLVIFTAILSVKYFEANNWNWILD